MILVVFVLAWGEREKYVKKNFGFIGDCAVMRSLLQTRNKYSFDRHPDGGNPGNGNFPHPASANAHCQRQQQPHTFCTIYSQPNGG